MYEVRAVKHRLGVETVFSAFRMMQFSTRLLADETYMYLYTHMLRRCDTRRDALKQTQIYT